MLTAVLSLLSACVTDGNCPSWLTRPPVTEQDAQAMSDGMVEWTLKTDSKIAELCR